MSPSACKTFAALATLAVIFALNAFAVTPAHASVPLTLPFQGRVLLKDGNPVPDGSYPAVFRLYRGESGGVAVWSEVHEGVVAVRGIVAATLGLKTSLAPVDFSAGEYFLGVEFNNDGEMAPRARLTSLPSALASLTLEGRRASDFLLKKGNQTFEGNLTLSSGSSLTTTGTISGGNFLQGGVALDDRYLALTGGSLTGDLTLQGSGTDLTVGGTTTFTGVATFKATPVFETGVTLPSNVTVSTLTATGTISSDSTLTAKNGFTLQAGTLALPSSSVTDAMVRDDITASNYLTLAGGTLTGTLRVDAGIGIGIAAASDRGVNISHTTLNDDYHGVYNTLTASNSGSGAATVYGLKNSLGAVAESDPIAPPDATGVFTQGTSNDATNVNYGYVYATSSSSPPTAGTHYAFYADASNAGGTKWGLYIQGAAGNYLANALRIGGTAATPSGNLDIRQIANGNVMLYSRRNTDSSPTGNFLRFQNAAGSNLFTVDVSGAVTSTSLDVGSGALTAGQTTLTTATGVPLTVNTNDELGVVTTLFSASDNATNVFSVLANGNAQIANGLTLGIAGGSTLTIGRTSGSGTATINLNDANTTYAFKAVNPTREFFIYPRDCVAVTGPPSDTNVGDFDAWGFSGTADNSIRCSFTVPTDWKASTNLTLTPTWTGSASSSADTRNIVWQAEYNPRGDSEDVTTGSVSDTVTNCVSSLFIAESVCDFYTTPNRRTVGGITLTGTNFAAGDVVSVEFSRLAASNATDNYLSQVNLLLLYVQYTTLDAVSG